MKTTSLIRIAAAIALFTVLWTIIPDWQSYVGFLRGLRHLMVPFEGLLSILWLFYVVVLLSHSIGSIALFRIRRWAWNLLMGALLMQILLTLFTVIRFSFVSPPAPPPIEGDDMYSIISMWPSYVRAILNTLAVSLLFTPKVRAHITNMDTPTPNNRLEPIKGTTLGYED